MDNNLTCQVVNLQTPNNYLLKGLTFSGKNPKTGFIVVHGLGGNLFTHQDMLTPLLTNELLALFFNNRGHDQVSYTKQLSNDPTISSQPLLAGAAFEVFTDCVDDINGALNFLSQKDINNFYLIGHSTGCQKIIYYLNHSNLNENIKGAVLLSPMSDYAYALKQYSYNQLEAAINYAKNMISHHQDHQLMPAHYTYDQLIDAQRFLSLYSQESVENIFSYANPKCTTILSNLKLPILALLGEQDEYRDRPIEEIANWFSLVNLNHNLSIKILSGLSHNLSENYPLVRQTIAEWLIKF